MDCIVTYDKALDFLKSGEVVAVPTETVYGLAGRIDRQDTLERIFSIKKRPSFDPLIVHCYDFDQAENYFLENSKIVKKLCDFFSPGPLTVVVQKNKKILPIITAHQETMAFRIPSHPLMKKLLKDLQVPLAAPSANIYSKLSPTKAEDVASSFSEEVFVLDGGHCEIGLESTIVYPDEKNKKIFILRPGMITKEHLSDFLKKEKLDFSVHFKQESNQPGSGEIHYQPNASLLFIDSEWEDLKILKNLEKNYSNLCLLPLNESPQKIARSLYAELRGLSQNKKNTIVAIRKSHQTGNAWMAIWDRLERASTAKISLK